MYNSGMVRRKLDRWDKIYLSIRELREAQKKTDKQLSRVGEQIRELREAQKKTDKQLSRVDEQIRELREAQKKTDKQLKETDRHLRETDKHLRETDKHLRETDKHLKETDKHLKETDKHLKETDAKIRRLADQLGKITDGWGKFVEGLVEPSVIKIVRRMGYKVEEIARYVKVKKGRIEAEFDLIMYCKKDEEPLIIVVEAKSTLEASDISDFVRNLERFYELFERYKGRKVIGCVAGVRFGHGAEVYGERQGLFVIGPSENMARILNKRGFKPRIFS